MKPLPKRKKSPEELAKLRENLGILAPPPKPRPQQGQLGLPQPADPDDPAAAPLPNTPLPARDRSQWRSLKQSELRVQPEAETPPKPASDSPAPFGLPRTPLIPVAQPQKLKPLRPPQPAYPPAPADATSTPQTPSKLPLQRHSPEELAQTRRIDALAVISQGAYQLPSAAHPVLLACGYLLAIGGAAAPVILDGLSRMTESYTLSLRWSHGYHLLTACSLGVLPIAAFIAITKSLSRHHGAFIAIIAFFALVFAAIHYFYQLRHAT